MLEKLQIEDFSPYLDKRIRAEKDGLSFELNLIEASPAKHSRDPKRKAFSLLFQGSTEDTFTQGTYTVHVDHLDQPALLFLVPIMAEGKDPYLEAIFN